MYQKNQAACLLAALACVLVLTAACTDPKQGNDEPEHIANNFTDLVITALNDPALEEFDRDVLQRAKDSGRVEQADYDEAYRRFAHCLAMSAKPVGLTRLSNGLYRVKNTPLSDGESIEFAMSVVTKCQRGTTNEIGELYGIQQGNPDLLADPFKVSHKCLHDKGMIDSSFSTEDLRKSIAPEGSRPSANLPFDANGDEAQACFIGANMTIVVPAPQT
ncbi:hypothetical protein ACIPY1_15020 [Paenarthrobacter nicotinovorans]|uniref:hypothetical protein n=1 Tax=Paenarthrobacter nicotinovorans TaxID=29320 RepID=UPI00382F17DE